ncbi:MAG TPA: hypothetical protein VHU84_14380, partial [Lacipirellulaceae bacterium]|nr:hypothetical protein [Lacipirellulaceae bacterium]
MLSGILTTCFIACYAIAFGLELFTLRRRPAWFPTPLIIAATIGILVHTIYLLHSSIEANSLPISTADWLLWAAWVLAIVYLVTLFYLPRTPTGLALIPIVLVLVLASKFASAAPLATEESFFLWGMFHGIALLLGTVTVSIGFLAGLMYLVQSYALKNSRSAVNRVRLPSLEWLERVNGRTL